MSRMSVATFLSNAKHSLSQLLRNHGASQAHASFVIGNTSADLDSIACALVYGYILSNTAKARQLGQYIIPITNIPSRESKLRPELTALLKRVDLKPADLITLDDLDSYQDSLPPQSTQWTLVDHNALLGKLGESYANQVTGVIDHHDDERQVPQHAEPRVIENAGSCNSLIVNYCREDWDALSKCDESESILNTECARIAILSLGAILIDTVNLTAEGKITDHDRRAVEFLERKIRASAMGRDYDRDAFFEEINAAKSDLDGLSVDDILRKDYKEWSEAGLTLGISSAVKPVEYLMNKVDNLENAMLDFAHERNVDLFALMTAHNDSDSFGRQLLLLSSRDGKAIDAAEKFEGQYAKELQLEESKTGLDSSVAWVRFWEQGNLNASRKQVGPMLRQAMR